MESIGFIGTGRLATGLAVGLNERGYLVTALYDSNPPKAAKLSSRLNLTCSSTSPQHVVDSCQIIFITTSDDSIEEVVATCRFSRGQYLIHCSGALSFQILSSAENQGAFTGSMHPLQAFADPDLAISRLPGTTFGIEGCPESVLLMERLAVDLGGDSFIISAKNKPLYHAAAVFASNYQVTLAAVAAKIFLSVGMNREQVKKVISAMMTSTVESIIDRGIKDSLTGPLERGDSGIVEKHLLALKDFSPEDEELYRLIGLKTIPIALDKGAIDEDKAKVIFELLRQRQR